MAIETMMALAMMTVEKAREVTALAATKPAGVMLVARLPEKDLDCPAQAG